MEKEYRITNEKELSNIILKFERLIAHLDENSLNSIFEERQRKIRIKKKAIIEGDLHDVFFLYFGQSLSTLNPNIRPDEIAIGGYYRSSKSNNNVIFKVDDFEKDKIFKFMWMSNNQLFAREFEFTKKNNNKIKIVYLDSIRGENANIGAIKALRKRVYIKDQKKAFKRSINDLKELLNKVKQ